MRILHVADLHLGRKGREEDILRQLEKVVKLCLEARVDLLLVAGDLFDQAPAPRRAKEALLEAVTPLREKGVRIVAICGNHDRGAGFEGQGVDFFEEPTEIPLKDGVLHLFPFRPGGSGRQMLGPSAEEGPIRIAVCHASYVSHPQILTQLAEEGLCWPLSSEEVKGLPYHYLALGHYHNPVLWRVGRVLCGYPGTIEPLSFKEEGPRKAYLVSSEGGLRVEEVDLGCQRPYRTLTWRVGIEVKEEEVPARIGELAHQKGFFRVILTGLVQDKERLEALVERHRGGVEVQWQAVDMRKIQGDPLLEGFVKLVKERHEAATTLLTRGLDLLGTHVD